MRKELLIAALGIGVSGTLDAATQQEVDRLLAKIAKSPPSENLSPGALCYITSAPPARAEYVCPECGSKTLYESNSFAVLLKPVRAKRGITVIYEPRTNDDWNRIPMVSYKLDQYRKECETLRKLGWDVKLDESFLCSKCRKPEQPEALFIVVTIDGKTTRTKLEHDDLRKLIAFVKGENIWLDEADSKGSLKPALPRIRELLGVSEEKK